MSEGLIAGLSLAVVPSGTGLRVRPPLDTASYRLGGVPRVHPHDLEGPRFRIDDVKESLLHWIQLAVAVATRIINPAVNDPTRIISGLTYTAVTLRIPWITALALPRYCRCIRSIADAALLSRGRHPLSPRPALSVFLAFVPYLRRAGGNPFTPPRSSHRLMPEVLRLFRHVRHHRLAPPHPPR